MSSRLFPTMFRWIVVALVGGPLAVAVPLLMARPLVTGIASPLYNVDTSPARGGTRASAG